MPNFGPFKLFVNLFKKKWYTDLLCQNSVAIAGVYQKAVKSVVVIKVWPQLSDLEQKQNSQRPDPFAAVECFWSNWQNWSTRKYQIVLMLKTWRENLKSADLTEICLADIFCTCRSVEVSNEIYHFSNIIVSQMIYCFSHMKDAPTHSSKMLVFYNT